MINKNKIVLFSILILFFYFWVATCGKYTFNYKDYNNSHYNLLTDGFLAGKLYLPIKPLPEFLALRDPYNPVANYSLRYKKNHNVHDTVYYKGKFYLYFGVTPVITLYLPYKLITKHNLPDNFAAFILSCGIFIFSIRILLHFITKYFPDIPGWMITTSIGVLGFSNMAGLLMRRSDKYEVAVLCGACFLTAAIYFFLKALDTEKINLIMLSLGSLFLGMAVGGRPQILFSGILLLLIFVKETLWKKHSKLHIKFCIALFIPYIFYITLLGAYNYFRFDSPFEYGSNYGISGVDPRTSKPISLKHVPANLYLIFFQRQDFNSHFPFIHLKSFSIPKFIPSPGHIDGGTIAGILTSTPFVLILFFYLFKLLFTKKDDLATKIKFPTFETLLILVPLLLNLLVLILCPFQQMRYKGDVMVLLLLLSCIFWFYLETILKNGSPGKFFIRFAGILFALFGMLNGIAFSVSMSEINLEQQNPLEFKKLESMFSWVIPIVAVISEIMNYLYTNISDIITRIWF